MSLEGGFVRATVDEMWERPHTFEKVESTAVYTNGADNQQPRAIDLVINNSPTASLATETYARFLTGKGFNIDGDKIVNEKKHLKLNKVLRGVARTQGRQGGYYLLRKFSIGKDGKFEPTFLQNLNFSKCRIAKEDDAEYDGAIYYKDWAKSSMFSRDKEGAKWFHPFSRDQSKIKAQLLKDAGLESSQALSQEDLALIIKKQRGQVLYVNTTPEYTYPLARIDAAFNDADTEYRISVESNNLARHGFQKKKLFLLNSNDTESNEEIRNILTSLLGIDGSAAYGLLETDNVDKLDEFLKTIELESDFDDDKYKENEKRIRRNIYSRFGINEAMVSSTDANVFGNSGESYKQMKAMYNQYTSDDRKEIAEAFNMALDRNDLQITPLEDVINSENGVNAE